MTDFDKDIRPLLKKAEPQEKRGETLEEFQNRIEEIAKTDPNFDAIFSKAELGPADQSLFEEFEAGNWSIEYIAGINMRSEDIDNQLRPSQKQLVAYIRNKIFERTTIF